MYWAKAIGVEHYNTFTPLLAAGHRLPHDHATAGQGGPVHGEEVQCQCKEQDNLPGKKKKIVMPPEANV